MHGVHWERKRERKRDNKRKKNKSDDKPWISMLLYRGIFGSVTSHNHKLFYCTVWSTKMIHTIRFTPIKPNWKKWQTQTIYTKMTIQIEELLRLRGRKKMFCGLLKVCVNDVKYLQWMPMNGNDNGSISIHAINPSKWRNFNLKIIQVRLFLPFYFPQWDKMNRKIAGHISGPDIFCVNASNQKKRIPRRFRLISNWTMLSAHNNRLFPINWNSHIDLQMISDLCTINDDWTDKCQLLIWIIFKWFPLKSWKTSFLCKNEIF